ncbi:MAG TPA: WD40 repeat domain-containing protein, partial [Gaiellaceae bacterium]
ESGGVHGAVARLAEGTYARIPDERKPLVRFVLLRLVGEGEGDAPVRRRAPLAELDLERNEDVAEVLGTLADSRLVTVSEGNVEVAHEALLREWPRLREWIDEDAEGRRLRRHITQAAVEWEAADRDQSELYRGARLAGALDWTADHSLDVNELEREFIAESREASERETRRVRRTNRRLRALLAGVAVLLVAAVAGGIFAAVQRSEARDAETGQLAQRLGAQALVEGDLDLSLLLARQAVAIDDTPQTRGYLLAALRRFPAAIGIMHGRQGEVLRGITVSPDGKTVAVAGSGGGVLFFDPRTDEQSGDRLVFEGESGEGGLAYSPDGRALAVGGDQVVRLIDARTHAQLAKSAVPGVAMRAAFTNDGSRLVVLVGPADSDQSLGDPDAQITVRDADTLKPIGRPIEPESFVGAYVGVWYASPQFALTPDDRFLLTASEDGELARWDLRTRRKTRTWRIEPGTAPALAVSPDGRTAAVGMKHGVQLVDLRSGATRTATADLAGSPNWLLFSPDGKTVVATNRDKTVTRWDVESATPLETLRGHSNFVQQPVFSPDGKTLYTVSHDGTAIAWDLAGDSRLGRPFTFTHDRTFSAGGYDGHPGRLSPDGRLLAVGLKEQGIALWDVRKLTPVGAPLLDTGGEVKSLNFSPDGRTLAAVTAESVGRGVLTLWDVDSRSRVHGPLYAGYPSFVLAVGFSPDGAMLATASSDRGLRFWDPATGDSLAVSGFNGSSASDVAFSADGALVASVMGQGTEVWDAASGTSIATFDSSDDTSVALSPDGHFLAVGGFGRVVRIFDVRTRKLVHALDQGGNGAFTLEFTPDGRTLAVSGFEPVASLWDVATGAQIGPQLSAGDRRTMIDLSSDGRHLLEIHANGKGAVWDVDPESWKRRACKLANRTLTHEEWDEFLPGRPYEPACAP